jgi:hypothetical protein
MKPGTAKYLRNLSTIYAYGATIEMIFCLVMLIWFHGSVAGLLGPGMLGFLAVTTRTASRRYVPEIEPKKPEPFTRTPKPGQCPVCGIEDLADYAFKDQFLALTGADKYVQKWGPHDAHWSCVVTVPYIKSQAEKDEEAHDGGYHSATASSTCEKCERQARYLQIEREDRSGPQRGCDCSHCSAWLASPSFGYSGYSYRHQNTRTKHYELMAGSGDPATRAYAMDVLERMIRNDQ